MMQNVRLAVKGCTENINDFKNPKVEMDNPRFIAEEAMRDVQDLFVQNIVPVVEDVLKMAAAMANKTVKNRRAVFKKFVHPNRKATRGSSEENWRMCAKR